jgi:hypothetical protein
MADLELIFKRNENFVFRKIGDEMILVPIKDNVGDMGIRGVSSRGRGRFVRICG